MNQPQSNQQSLRLPDENLVIIAGRITRDSEVRRTTNKGTAVCSFDVAMSKRVRDENTGEWRDGDPVFVPITVWGEQAERCADRVKKGAAVFIEGRLNTAKWEDKDTKQPRSRLEVIAQRVQFLTRSMTQNFQPSDAPVIGAKAPEYDQYQQQSSSAPAPASAVRSASAKDQAFGGDDEDIPF